MKIKRTQPTQDDRTYKIYLLTLQNHDCSHSIISFNRLWLQSHASIQLSFFLKTFVCAFKVGGERKVFNRDIQTGFSQGFMEPDRRGCRPIIKELQSHYRGAPIEELWSIDRGSTKPLWVAGEPRLTVNPRVTNLSINVQTVFSGTRTKANMAAVPLNSFSMFNVRKVQVKNVLKAPATEGMKEFC